MDLFTVYCTPPENYRDTFHETLHLFRNLSKCNLVIVNDFDHLPEGKFIFAYVNGFVLAYEASESELIKLHDELYDTYLYVDKLEKKLANSAFLDKAPKEIVANTRDLLLHAQAKCTNIEKSLGVV